MAKQTPPKLVETQPETAFEFKGIRKKPLKIKSKRC